MIYFRKDDGMLRTMNADKLLKTVPVLQSQLDALLEFDCSANDLTNGVINMSFMLLFRDLIRLFACYNDGIINLLGWYQVKEKYLYILQYEVYVHNTWLEVCLHFFLKPVSYILSVAVLPFIKFFCGFLFSFSLFVLHVNTFLIALSSGFF